MKLKLLPAGEEGAKDQVCNTFFLLMVDFFVVSPNIRAWQKICYKDADLHFLDSAFPKRVGNSANKGTPVSTF